MSETVTMNISEIPKRLMTAAFQVAYAKALEIQNLAQIFVPVKTGYLRDSITVEVLMNSEEQIQVQVSVKAPYASIVEFRQPFLAPAVYAVESTIQTELMDLQRSVVDVVQ